MRKMSDLASELLSVHAISEQDILLLKCPKTLCDPITVMNLRHDKIKYKHRSEKAVNEQNQRKRQAGNGCKENGPRKHELRVINKAIEEFKKEIEFIKKRFEMEMKPVDLFSENNELVGASDRVKFKSSKSCVIQNNSFRKWKNSMDATRAREKMSMKRELDKLKSNCQLETEKMDTGKTFSVSEKPIKDHLELITTGVIHNNYLEDKYSKCEADADEIQLKDFSKNSIADSVLPGNPEHVTNQTVHPTSNKLSTVNQVSFVSENGILDDKSDVHIPSNKFTLCTKKSKMKAEHGNISEDISKFKQPSNKQIMSKYFFVWKNYAFQCKVHKNNKYQSSSSKETCEHKLKIEKLIELLEKKKIEQKLVINKCDTEDFSPNYDERIKNRKISVSVQNENKADFIPADGPCSAMSKKTNKILMKYKLACEERDRLMDSLAKARKMRKLEADNEARRRQTAGEIPKWVFSPVQIIETAAKERSEMRKMLIKQRKLKHEAEIQALLKEEELRQEEEKSHLQLMSEKANKFYQTLLYKKYLLQPLSILTNVRKLNYDKCESFRKRKLLHLFFNTWRNITLTSFKVAQNFMKKCLLKRGYSAFVKVRIEAIQNNQVAIDFYDYFLIPRQVFTCWVKYHHVQIYKMERKLKISIAHYNRVLIRKYFSCWKIFHQDRELEARRNKWRMRVQEILPDFAPNLFCSRL